MERAMDCNGPQADASTYKRVWLDLLQGWGEDGYMRLLRHDHDAGQDTSALATFFVFFCFFPEATSVVFSCYESKASRDQAPFK